ncbi:MAG: hypothetical protein CBB97_22020 [Candidatus Endolissoclinum sp. TMED37]|nr:MAG: hypothetical protein CBB97_22020 [Candidatus Endolissoclinum sp. TMED37]|tara:strand:- start:40 stop:231 length:192 start_codon:yes stop_codon:yes gene_type:complete
MNMAGMMGQMSPQPMNGLSMSMNVNPLERLLQRSAGRSQGRSMAGVKMKKPRRSAMNGGMTYG